MTLLKLIKKIAADVENIKTRLDKHDEFIQYVLEVFKRNNLK